MSRAAQIAQIPDSRILRRPREEPGITDFFLYPEHGRPASVSHRISDRLPYICNTCHKNACAHTKRIQKWQEDYPNG